MRLVGVRFACADDTVIAHSMDRLACNLDDLRRLVRELTSCGIRVQLLKGQLTFTNEYSPMANLLLSVLGALSTWTGWVCGGACQFPVVIRSVFLSGCCGQVGDLVPGDEPGGHFAAAGIGAETVAAWPEVRGYPAERGEEPLRVPG